MGSLGLVGEIFEVKTQVDRDLTTVNRVDRQLGLNKDLRCHSAEVGDFNNSILHYLFRKDKGNFLGL
jgi:hypothetical protein